MKEPHYNGEILELWFEDGILCGIYKAAVVDLEVAKLATKERLTFTNGRDYPNMVDYSKVKETKKEARDYLAVEESSRHIKAMAVIINSMPGKVVYNFFLSINKPSFPMQVFNDKTKALEWLKQYK